MINPFKFFFPKKMVGVDMGTSSIKIVELSLRGKKKKLENYGEMKLDFLAETKSAGNRLPNGLASLKIKQILGEAKIKTKAAIFSVPDFLTFSTSFEIPKMPEKEIAGAIRYNASQYITLPISEVTLDWRVISDPTLNINSLIKVFIVAIPNQIILDYQAIAKEADLELYAIEPEVFSVTKSLVKDIQKTICLLEMGEHSSTLNIVDQGSLKRSYSSNFSGSELSSLLSVALKINHSQAEEMKNKKGLSPLNPEAAKTLYPSVDRLLEQVKNVCDEFLKSEQKQVQEIYLTGGLANLPGLREYFSKIIKMSVLLPDCFSEISYPGVLNDVLGEMNGRFSVAVGAALSGLEI